MRFYRPRGGFSPNGGFDISFLCVPIGAGWAVGIVTIILGILIGVGSVYAFYKRR